MSREAPGAAAPRAGRTRTPGATAADLAGDRQVADRQVADRQVWIFGYGSLMWEPGFAYLEAAPALVHGYHRAFCMYSYHHRGTREAPGLVLALDRGGSCRGRAYRVAAADAEAVFQYLHEREMSHYVYVLKRLRARLRGRRSYAYAYVADAAHEQYAGRLPIEAAAALIRRARGNSGANVEYLENTVRHLDELGIKDGPAHALLARVRGREA